MRMIPWGMTAPGELFSPPLNGRHLTRLLCRRLYDRSRMSNTSAGPSNSYTRTTETHRGSAHAWQRSGPRKDTYAPGASRHRAPGASPNYHYSPPHRKDTYNRTKPDTAMDRVARESDFWRAVQVIGGIVIATAISFNLAKG